jgi:hypothetical protein
MSDLVPIMCAIDAKIEIQSSTDGTTRVEKVSPATFSF